MKFSLDNNLSTRYVRALNELSGKFNHEVKHFRDYHNGSSIDPIWIESLGKKIPKRIIISGDGDILKKPHELKALHESECTFFYLKKDLHKNHISIKLKD